MGDSEGGSLFDKKKISKNTIKDHLNQGKIPPDSFDAYIRAFGQLKRLDITLDDGQKFSDLKTMRNLITLYCSILEPINEYYKIFKSLSYNFIPDKINNWDPSKEYSQHFWFLLSKCFEAFCTLEHNDVLFLNKFFKSDEIERQIIIRKMNSVKAVSYFDIVETLLNGKGKLWIDAYKNYSSNTEKKSSAEQNWEILKRKLENFATVKVVDKEFKKSIERMKTIEEFFVLIWPEKGETDTKFGPKEIKALIVWKYFLTEESRHELLEQFCEDQQNN